MRRAAIALVACAACGPEDHAHPDALSMPTDLAVLEQTVVTPSQHADRVLVPIAATAPGSLFVVAVAVDSDNPSVRSVTTSSAQHFDVDAYERISGCGHGLELWSLGDVDGAVTAVDVELLAPAQVAVYVIEVSGLSRFPLISSTNIGSSVFPPDELTIPVTEGAFVLASLTTCGEVSGLGPASQFTPLERRDASQVAFQIATARGVATVGWAGAGGPWVQYLLAYR